MEEYGINDLIDNSYSEYKAEEISVNNSEINRIISQLQLSSNNKELLTKNYTDILEDDNVVYIMTRISQNPIFKEHFPEFYEKNKYGESVINCQQNSSYHKYGVFKHILYTIESVGKDSLKYSSHDIKLLKWTMLLHDIGKPFAKAVNSEGNDSFAGHDDISVELADGIIDRFDFDENDKKAILTLIKYHDRFLNEGDLTYDNLSFLAKELENKRELFYLLIEVKVADNKAKSTDVYNKFMTVVGKYYDFASEYFGNAETNELFKDLEEDESIVKSENIESNEEKNEEVKNVTEYVSDIYKEGGSNSDITEDLINDLVRNITNGSKLKCYYQPIVDLQKQEVNGYEVFYKILTTEDFSYKQILRKAKEFDKYDKLQQMLFVNSLERFNELKGKREITEYVNIDAKSYLGYVNKARIFDLIDKNNVVLEFNNFETLLNSKIKELSFELLKRKALVAIDNFESSNKTIKDVEQIEPKCIKYKLKNLDDNVKSELQELATFCLSNSINLIVFGIDSKDLFNFVKKIGIRYVQGTVFGLPTENLDLTNEKVKQIILQNEENLIV